MPIHAPLLKFFTKKENRNRGFGLPHLFFAPLGDGRFYWTGDEAAAAMEKLFDWVGYFHVEDIVACRLQRNLIAGRWPSTSTMAAACDVLVN